GEFELLRQLHQSQCLAIPFRMRHSKIAREVLPRVATLLLRNHHHRAIVKPRYSTNQRLVIAKGPVSMQLLEVRKETIDVIERIRARRMPRQLNALPRGKPSVYLTLQFLHSLLNGSYFAGDVEVILLRGFFERVELLLETAQRLLKVQGEYWLFRFLHGRVRQCFWIRPCQLFACFGGRIV